MADNVEIAHRHRIVCDTCGLMYDAESAEDAEAYAVLTSTKTSAMKIRDRTTAT
jgi:hypothetical protein